MRQRPKTLGFASLLTVGVLMVGGCVVGPVTPLHYAPNNNFSSSGYYAPRAAGFNLADVSSVGEVRSLPSGVRALVWLGQCNGADSSFINAVQPFIGDPRVFGFYLMDEPDPTGQWNPLCPAANLRAESDWIHAHAPGAKTFIVMMNFDSSTSPTYANTYNPGNSHVDLYGIDPYPCRTEAGGCDYSMIPKAVAAAEATGIPAGSIVADTCCRQTARNERSSPPGRNSFPIPRSTMRTPGVRRIRIRRWKAHRSCRRSSSSTTPRYSGAGEAGGLRAARPDSDPARFGSADEAAGPAQGAPLRGAGQAPATSVASADPTRGRQPGPAPAGRRSPARRSAAPRRRRWPRPSPRGSAPGACRRPGRAPSPPATAAINGERASTGGFRGITLVERPRLCLRATRGIRPP